MNTNINIRLSEEEKSLIKQKAKKAGMKLSEYVRSVSLGDCVVERNLVEIITIK